MRHRDRPARLPALLAAVFVALLGLTTLAGCRTSVGVAASVDSFRISDSDVGNYLLPSGPSPVSSSASGSPAPQAASPKSRVLDLLIQRQVFTRALQSAGGVPGDADLAASRDTALAQQTGVTSFNEATFQKGFATAGLTTSFLALFERTVELKQALATKAVSPNPSAVVLAVLQQYVTAHGGTATTAQLQSLVVELGSTQAKIIAALPDPTIQLPADLQTAVIQGLEDSGIQSIVGKLGLRVSVDARYGAWDAQSLALSGTAPLPDYLSVIPTPTPTPVSSSAPVAAPTTQ